MPKLSQHTLEKMFKCQICGELLRTRQGLSGHIQWKHNAGKSQPPIDYDVINALTKEWEKYGKIMLLPDAQIRAQENILKNWPIVHVFCKYLKIKLNNTDFKNYILASFARMYECEELEERLFNRIKNLLGL
jgi:hypothetical protein